jgi:hypothetical protein
VNHTNQRKQTADLADDSYDKGKDYKSGDRDNKVSDKGLESWDGKPYPPKKKKK